MKPGNAETGPVGTEDLLRMARGFFSSRLILAAARLELFDALPATTDEIVGKTGWNAEALRRVLDALTAMAILKKEGENPIYAVADPLKDALGRDPDRSVLPMVEHLAHLWECWSDLDEIVRTGKISEGPNPILADPDRLRSFIGAMHAVGRDLARDLAAELDLDGVGRLLDVGGASGTYVAAFLERMPAMRATLFDLPEVVPLAEERLGRVGLLDRVTLVPGNYNRDPLPEGHDRVWLSAIVHQNSRTENVRLYEKCYRALVPGGRLWIRDDVMDETRTEPAAGAIFDINMLVATRGGATFTRSEFRADLESAGFADVRILRYGERMDTVVEAVRP